MSFGNFLNDAEIVPVVPVIIDNTSVYIIIIIIIIIITYLLQGAESFLRS